jgi:hypothetical protein
MPFQAAPGVAQVRMRFQSDGQEVDNIFSAAKSDLSLWTQAEMDSLGSLFLDYWNSFVKPLLCSNTLLDAIRITDLSSRTSLQTDYRPADADRAGTHTGSNLPNNVTAAVKLGIGVRSRGVNGRIFLPTIPVAEVVLNTLNTAYSNSWKAAIQHLIDHVPDIGAGIALAVLSRYTNHALRPTGIGRPVTNVDFTNESVDSQKLRLPNHKKRKRHV